MTNMEKYINNMHYEVGKSLQLLNSIMKPLGIVVKYENNRLVPYYNDKKLQNMGTGNCYVLPSVPKTQKVSLWCDFEELLRMERNIWADAYRIRIMPNASYFVNDREISVEGPTPFVSLEWHALSPSNPKFEVRIAQRYNGKTYEPECSNVRKREVVDNTIMTILYASRRAIIVEKDMVRVGKNVDRYWDDESGEFIEMPYSGYDDLYNTLEVAIDNLLNNEWSNPNKANIESGGNDTLYLRVFKNFLLSEVKRAIEYIKERDNKKGDGEKTPQLRKQEKEVKS